MPNFTITLSDEAVTRLTPVRDKLSMEEWLVMVAKAAAIGEEFAANVGTIQKQHEQDKQTELQTAIEDERTRLLGVVA